MLHFYQHGNFDLTHANWAIADKRLGTHERNQMPKGKRKRHTPEQIVAILRRSESSETAATICWETSISLATFRRWKSQYGGMELNELQQLRGLRDENARLKRLVADQALHIQVLKEMNAKKMVSPMQKRRAAVSVERSTGRQACRCIGLGRSTWHYTPQAPTPRAVQLEQAILKLSRDHPRYGYRRVHAMLPRQGLRCALRAVQHVRRHAGVQITGPAVRPKTPPRPDAKIKSEGVYDVRCVESGQFKRHYCNNECYLRLKSDYLSRKIFLR
jgi:putative transposase